MTVRVLDVWYLLCLVQPKVHIVYMLASTLFAGACEACVGAW